MLGLGAVESTQHLCQAFDEVRNYFQPRIRMRKFVSLSAIRYLFVIRMQALQALFQAT